MNNDEKIREQVKEYYSKAVTGGSTCGCGCSDITPKGIISSKMGEYSFEELENIPKEAVENSFGCGNPLAFSELKEGDRFYYLDGLIYRMLECKVVSPTQIDFVAKLIGNRDILKMSLHSDVSTIYVYRYNRRNKPSFNNGFKQAIEYCKQYMSPKEIAIACLDNDAMIHSIMNSCYNRWKSMNRV